MLEFLSKPWPWYVAGPMIGLFVPLLLLIGNKSLGISSTFQHICAAALPTSKIDFFKYNWKDEAWTLAFAIGIILGGVITYHFLWNDTPIAINTATIEDLKKLGITDFSGYMPNEIFSIKNILSLKGILFFLFGGFLVGFGTRYANGCTSGHSIFGLSILNWPSLVATICFMIGGFISAWLIVPVFLKMVM